MRWAISPVDEAPIDLENGGISLLQAQRAISIERLATPVSAQNFFSKISLDQSCDDAVSDREGRGRKTASLSQISERRAMQYKIQVTSGREIQECQHFP
jgi:hypothetical protein